MLFVSPKAFGHKEKLTCILRRRSESQSQEESLCYSALKKKGLCIELKHGVKSGAFSCFCAAQLTENNNIQPDALFLLRRRLAASRIPPSSV